MRGVKQPIAFASYYPSIPETDNAQPRSARTPAVWDVEVRGLVASGSSSAGYLVGLPEQPFTDVRVQDVSIAAEPGLEVRNASVLVKRTTISTTAGPSFDLRAGAILR
jgi:hypothetical protein